MNIVVVEDEVRTRKGIINLISKIDKGYKIIGEAVNGIEGIKVIEETHPQLVITDIKMPQLSGLEMLQRFKNTNTTFKSIMLTGFAEFDFAKEAVSLGVFEYLLKPITIEDLRDVLERVDQEIIKEKARESSIIKTSESLSNDQFKYLANSLKIHKVLDIIKNQFAEAISLDAIADGLHITPEYLSSLFYKEVGKNFTTYLREYRIHKSKELIINSDLKIYEIAQKVGYNDAKYFCRVFKSVTGLTTGNFITRYK